MTTASLRLSAKWKFTARSPDKRGAILHNYEVTMVRKLILVAVVLLAGCSQSLTTQGRKFVEQGEYDRAIEAFYSEIARNPQSVDAWRELGIAYYEQGNLEKAEDALKQANGIKASMKSG